MYKIKGGGESAVCGRFTQKSERKIITEEFYVQEFLSDVYISYNIAPGQEAGVIFRDRVNTYARFRWGLVPFWAKDPKIGYRMINARGETVAKKPSFKRAFAKQRCIIPADGFYEWKKGGAYKTPFFVTHYSGRPMAFAGLWEVWKPKEVRGKKPDGTAADRIDIQHPEDGKNGGLDEGFNRNKNGKLYKDSHRVNKEERGKIKSGKGGGSDIQGDLFSSDAGSSSISSHDSTNTPLYTFTIITTSANEKMRELHDRMPVIIPPSRRSEWLDPGNEDTSRLTGLLVPISSDEIEFYEVSRIVNSPKNNSPECIQPLV